ncbi:immunoglobulin-like domain-containing protein [candidate division KSB1 bacterium]
MFQKLTHFIKYHNSLPIAISLIVAGSGAALAATNDTVREQIIAEEVVVRSVDNAHVIATDLEVFNPELQITAVEEDGEFYYVSFQYNTISIDDYIWKDEVAKDSLAVSKASLGERDLGNYVAEQLGETVESKMSYLKEVQGIEKSKGSTKKVATVTYSGLVGKFLEPKEETFEGYTQVKEDEKPYVATVEEAKQSVEIAAVNAVSSQIAAAIPSKEEVELIIERKVAELLAQKDLTASIANVTTADTSTSTSSVSTSTSTTQVTTPDTEPPVIIIVGNNPAEIAVRATYADLGATVTDNVNDNLGISYAVDGAEVSSISLDTSSDVTYTITYSATDQAGNVGTAERSVIVGTGVPVVVEAPIVEPVATSTPTTTSAQTDTTTNTATSTAEISTTTSNQ